MLRSFITAAVVAIVGILYLSMSGVKPSSVNLPLEVGLTLISGSIFILIDRIVTGDPNKEVIKTIDGLREEIKKLNDQLTKP